MYLYYRSTLVEVQGLLFAVAQEINRGTKVFNLAELEGAR